jgi:hypothetical protein
MGYPSQKEARQKAPIAQLTDRIFSPGAIACRKIDGGVRSKVLAKSFYKGKAQTLI